MQSWLRSFAEEGMKFDTRVSPRVISWAGRNIRAKRLLYVKYTIYSSLTGPTYEQT